MKDKLPEDLRIELLKSAYSIYYNKIYTIFSNSLVIRFLFYLTERKYTHNEVIFEQGERSNALYYLQKGFVEFFLKTGSKMNFIYQTNIANEFLGHYELFLR